MSDSRKHLAQGELDFLTSYWYEASQGEHGPVREWLQENKLPEADLGPLIQVFQEFVRETLGGKLPERPKRPVEPPWNDVTEFCRRIRELGEVDGS